MAGCAGTIPENRELAFVYAVDQLKSDRPEAAAGAAWRYLQGATVEDPRYDRAQRLLARASQDMGPTYAAAQRYLDIAQGRRDPELLAESVRGLQTVIDTVHSTKMPSSMGTWLPQRSKDYPQIFRPCAVPPGFQMHDYSECDGQ